MCYYCQCCHRYCYCSAFFIPVVCRASTFLLSVHDYIYILIVAEGGIHLFLFLLLFTLSAPVNETYMHYEFSNNQSQYTYLFFVCYIKSREFSSWHICQYRKNIRSDWRRYWYWSNILRSKFHMELKFNHLSVVAVVVVWYVWGYRW